MSTSVETIVDLSAWPAFWQRILARNATPQIGLIGTLGAGKTTSITQLAQVMGIEDEITSPTFELVHIHEADPPLIHCDLYRLVDPAELVDLGYGSREWRGAVICIEWPDRFRFVRDECDLVIEIAPPTAPDAPRQLTLHWRD